MLFLLNLLNAFILSEGKGVPLSRAEEGEQYDSCRADDEASITSEPNKVSQVARRSATHFGNLGN